MTQPLPASEIFYWPRSFVMRSTDFVQNKPYQRIATTLICQPQGELQVETQDRGMVSCAAIVLGPTARRLSLRMQDKPAFLIEAQPLSAEHRALMQFLQYEPSRPVTGESLATLSQVLNNAPETLTAENVRRLHKDAIQAVQPLANEPVACDERIAKVLQVLENALLEEVAMPKLAAVAGVSESRLRSLARKQLGCSLSQYVRWLAAWKIAEFWRPGITLTDAAHAAGFHDLAHANHATNEMFGMSPSRVFKAESVRLHNCTPMSD